MRVRIGIAVEVENLTISSDGEIIVSSGSKELKVPSNTKMLFKLIEPADESWVLHVEPEDCDASNNWEVIEVGTNLILPTGQVLIGTEKWCTKSFEDKKEAFMERQQLWKSEKFAYIKHHIVESGVVELSYVSRTSRLQSPVYIKPLNNVIKLHGVAYGKGFHWERREEQIYSGEFFLYAYPQGITLVNIVDVEDYMMVVNSSEMHPDAPMEVLKAQTIAARSTLVSTRGKHHFGEPFDLCNTDHCQVYRGLQQVRDKSRRAVEETWGKILAMDNELVDARYAKTCGGITEDKKYVWGGRKLNYLISHPDNNASVSLKTEEDVINFINSRPEAYCNISPTTIHYIGDPLYRWEIEYEPSQLVEIIRKKTGIEFNELNEVEVVKRGASGRAISLLLHTDRGTFKVFTELEIRRVLSESHLPSSLFCVERRGDKWIFRGAGWGHGVGMCQVGAVGMAIKGKTYKEILSHYYPGTEIVKAW